eukprot:CAMPEP_0197032398 /NCGR_PEP_ID=MMETSP1384-20130603/11087_1 /TAXON_ID=29189 /ORGANISM="Ammonia sp." /LENGTH=66 /DNA_ID=CAMNT_0042462049 /DNA_START=78 /DNA_END=278 /DNA_ORIENTATION=+
MSDGGLRYVIGLYVLDLAANGQMPVLEQSEDDVAKCMQYGEPAAQQTPCIHLEVPMRVVWNVLLEQ